MAIERKRPLDLVERAARRRALRTSQEPPAQPWRREILLPSASRGAPESPRVVRALSQGRLYDRDRVLARARRRPHRIRDAAPADGGLSGAPGFSSRNRWLSNSARLRFPLELASALYEFSYRSRPMGGSGGRFRACIDTRRFPTRQGWFITKCGGGGEWRRFSSQEPSTRTRAETRRAFAKLRGRGRDRTGRRHRPANHCGQASRARDLVF